MQSVVGETSVLTRDTEPLFHVRPRRRDEARAVRSMCADDLMHEGISVRSETPAVRRDASVERENGRANPVVRGLTEEDLVLPERCPSALCHSRQLATMLAVMFLDLFRRWDEFVVSTLIAYHGCNNTRNSVATVYWLDVM